MAGERAEARRVWQQVLTILAELDHPEADHVRAKLISIGDAMERPRDSPCPSEDHAG